MIFSESKDLNFFGKSFFFFRKPSLDNINVNSIKKYNKVFRNHKDYLSDILSLLSQSIKTLNLRIKTFLHFKLLI